MRPVTGPTKVGPYCRAAPVCDTIYARCLAQSSSTERSQTEAEAVVPVFDHGFLYGEGVYEVCRTYHGQPFLLDRHLTRLRASAGLIALAGAV